MPVLVKDKEFNLFTKELEHLFSKDYIQQLAKDMEFMQRKTKFRPEYFVQFCSFSGNSLGKKSLAELCAQLSELFDLEITTEGLNQRFNEFAVDFLRKIFRSLLMIQMKNTLPLVEDRLFHAIRILDSSSFDLPAHYEGYEGPNGSGIKLQLEYELYEGLFRHLHVQKGKESDSKYAEMIEDDIHPGDLFLRDLGYFSRYNLLKIDRKGGYFISRLKSDTNLYQKEEQGKWQKLDKLALTDALKPGEIIELTDVKVGARKKDPLVARVVITKLTKEQEKRRQEHINMKKGKGNSSLSAQKNVSINTFVTNISQEMVDGKEIYSLYSLRWQIEILFKTWKSLFEIHEVKDMKKERFECHLYGTLIQLIVCSTMAFQCRRLLYEKEQLEASEFKAISLAKEHLSKNLFVLIDRKENISEFFSRIYRSIRTNGRKSHRQQRRTVFDILHIGYKQCVSTAA